MHQPSSLPAGAATKDRFSDPVFRKVDDSPQTLLHQLALAGVGMTAALAAGRLLGDRVGRGRRRALGTTALQIVLGLGALHVTSARPIRIAVRAQRRLIEDTDDELRAQLERAAFESEVRSALELVEDEGATLRLVGDALAMATEAPVELLLADSSRAHLHVAATAPGRPAPSCGVLTPWDCPAVRSGRTQRFATTDRLSCCPKLRGRAVDEPLQAACVPVTVLGQPAGVVHAVLPAATTADAERLESLVAVAVHAGSRLGVIRAMASSELRADTDPLTGLLNRRAFEERLRIALDGDRELTIAYCDLDHFKHLNDAYGHHVGDRALRVVARALRQGSPPGAVVGRRGGEEFVLALDVPFAEAAAIAEQVRAAVVDAAFAAGLPAFTMSVGLAPIDDPADIESALSAADRALLSAKAAGRDRVALATELERPAVEDEAAPRRLGPAA